MQEKKNNAIEKVEQIENSNNLEHPKKVNKTKSVSKNHKKNSNSAKKDKAIIKRQKKAEKELIKENKEKIRAQKRIELARLKAHKKAEKEKALATALREKNRRKAELKQKRLQLLQERRARKDALRKETKKQRAQRIKQEKQERAEIRAQKLQERREIRREKAQKRRENKGFGGWLSAVISLGISTLVLSGVLLYLLMAPTPSFNALEQSYQRSFYDVVERIDNIDLNMSKLLATKDSGAMQNYLVDVAINSELAENDLQQLPLKDESKFYTAKVVNQIGDFAKYANKKLVNGDNLSKKDLDSLQTLYQANLNLKNSLQNMLEKMGNDYTFSTMQNGGVVLDNFNQLQNLSVEYPELIYDGPFSDGIDNREIKGLSGATISETRAMEIFLNLFADKNPEDAQMVGSTNGNIECFNIQAMVDDDILYAQISKIGGKLIMFDYAGNCLEQNHTQEYAIEKAQEFLSKQNLKNMKPVWVNLANNVFTINFAFEQDNIVIYSDLIKVRVCAQTGNLLGQEATSYFTNHTERAISNAQLTKSSAAEKVNSGIELISSRLVIVPVGVSSEKLCFEFMGEYNNSTYYVYIDAINGNQVEMFKVIESTEGTLLM